MPLGRGVVTASKTALGSLSVKRHWIGNKFQTFSKACLGVYCTKYAHGIFYCMGDSLRVWEQKHTKDRVWSLTSKANPMARKCHSAWTLESMCYKQSSAVVCLQFHNLHAGHSHVLLHRQQSQLSYKSYASPCRFSDSYPVFMALWPFSKLLYLVLIWLPNLSSICYFPRSIVY